MFCSKITVDREDSHAVQRRCLEKKLMDLDGVLKITLPTKVYLIRAMVFPVVIYRCES